jgi:molecular chaperone GrpE
MSRKKSKAKADQRPPAQPDADPQSAAAPAAEPQGVAEPDQQTQDLQAERDEMLARLERVSADYHNYQKRVQRDLAQAQEYAHEELMKAVLTVLDDMERALEAGRANHDADDPLLKGMQLVHDNALAALGRFGLTVIDAVGRPFDPDLHSALMQQPTDDHPPQTVLTEVQKGYRLKGRTLRPSKVVVAAPAGDAPPAPEPTGRKPPDAEPSQRQD